jgi:hypothetical protein
MLAGLSAVRGSTNSWLQGLLADYDPLDEEGMDGVVRDVASFLLAFAPRRVVQVKT